MRTPILHCNSQSVICLHFPCFIHPLSILIRDIITSCLIDVVAHVPHYLVFHTTLPFHSLLSARCFGIWIFLSHGVAYLVSFDSRFETRKSDIIRPRYELFNACGGSSLSLCSLLHNITLAFHSLLSARVSEFGFFHPMS